MSANKRKELSASISHLSQSLYECKKDNTNKMLCKSSPNVILRCRLVDFFNLLTVLAMFSFTVFKLNKLTISGCCIVN